MEQKIRKASEKYEVVVGLDEVIYFDSLIDAEKRLKSLRSIEVDSYLVKKEYDENDKLINEIMLGL